MAKGQVKLLWLVASALVILLAGCNGASSSTPGREIGTAGAEVDGSRTDSRMSESQSAAVSVEGSGSLRMVKFTVPTIT